MTTHVLTLRVSATSEQPEAFVASAAAAGVRGILDGWTDDVQVCLVREADDWRDN